MVFIRSVWLGVIGFAVMVGVGGCELIGPDQSAYAEDGFVRAADLVQRQTVYGSEPAMQSGTHTLLIHMDGWSHGRRTTAHGSRHLFFFVLPAELRECQTYRCTAQDGTLSYDGFAGYWPWRLSPDKTSEAIVTVLEVSDRRITAEIELAGFVQRKVHRDFQGGWEDSENPIITRTGKWIFRPVDICWTPYLGFMMFDAGPCLRTGDGETD